MGRNRAARRHLGLAAGAPAAPADPSAAASPDYTKALATAERGVSGTVNYSGRIEAEANPRLRHEQAYGSPGQGTTWGVWERLIRTDSAVSSALDMVAAPLRDALVEVEPASEDALHVTQAEYVRDNLLEWLEPQWAEVMQQLVRGSLGYGFSLHELVGAARRDPRVPGGLGLFLRKLAQRLPSSIESNGWLERDGELSAVRQSGVRDGKYEHGIELPAEKLLLLSWNREGNNYPGFSALRPVYYLATIREALLKIFAIGSEREALGVPMASVDKDAPVTKEQLDAFQAFLQHIGYHEHAAVVAPKGVSMEWVHSSGANKGHVIQAWRDIGVAIHEVMQTQQVALGTGNTGSRAVGEVHDATKNAFIQGVKANVEAALNGVGERAYTGIPRRIVQWNWGPQAAYPRIKLVLKKPDVPIADIGTALPALVNAGIVSIGLEDENSIRERFGLAPIEEADRAMRQGSRTTPPAPGFSTRTPHLPPGAGGSTQPPAQAAYGVQPLALNASRAPWLPRRPLRACEQHLALAEMDSFLVRAKEDFERSARDAITAAVAKALPAIRDAMADGDPSEVADLELDTTELEAAIERFVDGARAEGYRQVQKEQRSQPAGLIAKRQDGQPGVAPMKLAAEEEREDTQPGATRDDDAPAPARDTRKAVARTKAMVSGLKDRLLRRTRARTIDDIEAEAIGLVRTGGDPAQIVPRVVARALETRGLKQDAGLAVTTAFNVGREEFARERGDQVESVVYSAILDGRQCAPCDSADGQEFEFGSAAHDEHVPPYRLCEGGENCRCILVYQFKDAIREVP